MRPALVWRALVTETSMQTFPGKVCAGVKDTIETPRAASKLSACAPASVCGCDCGSHSLPPLPSGRVRRTVNSTGLCVPLRKGVASISSLNSRMTWLLSGADCRLVGETSVALGGTPLRSTMPWLDCSVQISVWANGLPDVLRTISVWFSPPTTVIV